MQSTYARRRDGAHGVPTLISRVHGRHGVRTPTRVYGCLGLRRLWVFTVYVQNKTDKSKLSDLNLLIQNLYLCT